MAYQPFQGITSVVNTIPSSVQVGASIFGQLPAGVQPLGSIAVLQGTNPWQINVPTPSYIAYQLAGSVLQVAGGGGGTQYTENNASTPSVVGNAILYKKDETNSVLSAVSPQHPLPIQGSIAALQSTNPWIVGLTSGSVIATQIANSVMGVRTDNASVIAVLTNSSVAVLQGTTPWAVTVAGSVMAASVTTLQGTNPWLTQIIGGSVTGTYTENSISSASVIGHAILYKKDETNSVLSAVSPQHPLPVQGSIAALQSTLPWTIVPTSGSIIATQIAGSVMNINASGSVAAAVINFTASVAANVNVISTSIATNLQSTNASIIAIQGTSSWVSKPFVVEDASVWRFSGSVQSTSITLIQASIAGKKFYITDFWIANSGAATTAFSFLENSKSVLGTTIAPAGSGSNSPGIAIPLKTANAGLDLNFQGLTATSTLYVTINGYQATS